MVFRTAIPDCGTRFYPTMSEHLPAQQFGQSIAKRVFGIMIVGLIPAFITFIVPALVIPKWLPVGAYIASGFAAGYLTIRQLRQFRCPRCGECIQKHVDTRNQENTPIIYFCKSCDVEWDTGLRTPSGSL
jgi:predicted RNA-binding Zn-ribbon protein involved in translation (DUF1610 family)